MKRNPVYFVVISALLSAAELLAAEQLYRYGNDEGGAGDGLHRTAASGQKRL